MFQICKFNIECDHWSSDHWSIPTYASNKRSIWISFSFNDLLMNNALAFFKHNYASTCMNNILTKVTNFDHISCCTCNYSTFCLWLVHFMCLKISCWFRSPYFETLASCWTLFKHVPCFHILHTCQWSYHHKMIFKSHLLSNVLFMNIHLLVCFKYNDIINKCI